MKLLTAIIRWVLLTIMSVTASDSFAAPDISNNWNSLTSDPAFHYKNSKETLQGLEQPQNDTLSQLGTVLLTFFASPAGKLIGWILFFILLAWALFKIFFHDGGSFFEKKAKKADKKTNEAVEQNDLISTDWENQLDRAVLDANPRMAVRSSFMRSLQLLQLNGLIQFEDNKTNAEYYQELSTADIKRQFRQLSKQYEHTWYGHFEISDDAYRSYMSTFNELKNRLRQP